MLLRSVAVGLSLAILALSSSALASVVVGLDLPTLVSRSEHVVAAEVQACSARYDVDGRIVTDVLVRVDEVGKGPSRRGEVLQLLLLGGTVGELTMRVEGGAVLREGERAMLFLERHPTGHLIPAGFSQGVMRIREQNGRTVVAPGGQGLALVRRGAHGRVVPTEGALTEETELASVLERVRGLARGGAR